MSLEVVSIHFPKAAGTSLRHDLQRHFGSSLHVDYDADPLFRALEDAPDIRSDVRAVHGHFHASRYARYSGAFAFTFLREPIDNLISTYFYWQTLPPAGKDLHSRFHAERPSLLEFARYPGVSKLTEHYFGGVDLDRLGFVGFYEHRREDLSRLSSLVAFPSTPTIMPTGPILCSLPSAWR